MKKLLSIILAAVMLCSMNVYVFADGEGGSTVGYDASTITMVTDFTGFADMDDVTADNYANYTNFYIDSATGLTNFSTLVNTSQNYSFLNKNVYLKNNIDMSGATDFAPIGSATGDTTTPTFFFAGTFDGQGYEIQNLTVTSATRVCNALFGAVRGCAIRNLVIAESCSFSYTGTSTGRTAALVAVAAVHGNDSYSTATVNSVEFNYPILIENVCNRATVSTTKSGVGGLIAGGTHGTNRYLYIRNCTNEGAVTNDTDSAGGICARMENTFRGVVIENCLNTGAVTSPFCAGGILGDVTNATLVTQIVGCVNTGTITATNAGAITGQFRQANTVIKDCTNYGYIDTTVNSIYGNKVNGNTDNVVNCIDKYTGSAEYEFAQKGTDTDANIRIIASIDNLNYQRAGFKIIVKDSEGAVVQVIDHKCLEVYDSVCGEIDGNIIEYSANVTDTEGDVDGLREGGYLYALIIKDIPTGSYTFNVTPYSVKDGYTVYGSTTSFNHAVEEAA